MTAVSPRNAPQAELVIDLDAIAGNWLQLAARGKPAGSDCAAVVKADAYGLGAVPVVQALYAQGCRHFFVAQPHEAAAIAPVLAEAASMATADRARIYLLNGPWGLAAADIVRAGFIPVLNSLDDLRYWAREAPAGAPVVVHIDTGMNRLGLSVSDLAAPELAALLSHCDLRYVMSHLVCADDPAHAMNTEQLALFKNAAAVLGRPLRLSLANSSGIFLGTDYHFDLLRPGCALYGINPVPTQKNPMQQPVSLKARVLQVRTVPQGQTIGYGATYRVAGAEKYATKTYATLALGYADGYLRSLSDKGQVWLADTLCPVAGRVSMDSIVVDVSHAPVPPLVGDMAVIIGPETGLDADGLAVAAGTIGYEILTALGQRYARTYKGALS